MKCCEYLPKMAFRIGRAHYVCIECGRDCTMPILLAYDAGVKTPFRTPDDYKPVHASKLREVAVRAK